MDSPDAKSKSTKGMHRDYGDPSGTRSDVTKNILPPILCNVVEEFNDNRGFLLSDKVGRFSPVALPKSENIGKFSPVLLLTKAEKNV